MVAILMLGQAVFAEPLMVVDETFQTTFSDYNQIRDILECTPGYQGGFATPDRLSLQSHSVELGFNVDRESFRGESRDALEKESNTLPPMKRPYDVGCKPAIEKFIKALEGKDVVEVTVHRQVRHTSNIDSRVHRKLNGEVNHVKYFQTEVVWESYEVTIAGIEFSLMRTSNGKSKEL